ncbi:MAG: signal peptidase II [Candidatus Omnitrophica bacterium]|nr:signal peptidase II [Candidatus Omnitrophota bacterium]
MLIILFCFVFFLLDFGLKTIITAKLAFNTAYPLIGNIVSLRLVHNTGVAFGLLQGKTNLVIFIGVAFIVVFLFFALREKHTPAKKVFLGMILAGALGNLYDRVFLGYVIDYIDLGWWPVFNLADSFITVGCAFFLVSCFLSDRKKSRDRFIA